jgi:glutaredoxin
MAPLQVKLLEAEGVRFGSFDVLTDEAVRQGIKDRGQFPTYPQLWVGGELIGGLDIVTELRDSGELAAVLPPKGAGDVVSAPVPPAAAATAGAPLDTSAPSGISGPLTLSGSNVLLPDVAAALQVGAGCVHCRRCNHGASSLRSPARPTFSLRCCCARR